MDVTPARAEELDPITVSVLTSALVGIAEEMGSVLVRGAFSANIKERRDCSSAIFDSAGRMVAQAEHIPVHLGAMPESVAAVRALGAKPGDVYAVNDPYAGGTHLPDITLVTPIAFPLETDAPAQPCGSEDVLGYAVTRAHHSDIGGMHPGSMPATSGDLWQEGLVIPPVRLMAAGEWVSDVLTLIVANSRTPRERRGDFRAQVAANQVAITRLHELCRRYGTGTVTAAFDAVLGYSERRAREAIAAVPDGCYRAASAMEGDGHIDDDIPIQVQVRIHGTDIEVDLRGSSPAVAGNINCPVAVTRSACYFALRVLIPDDIPANAGTYKPLRILTDRGSMLHAEPPSAVVAGNVETSQAVADTVLAALRQATPLPAQGQGTMNNLVIGGAGWGYYETIAGGQGAGPDGPGASGVHVGMTNTLNTPVEALELEFPMRVERYELLDNTGGEGHYRGGDGLVRTMRVLEPATVSLLTEHRRHRPAGAAGGADGALGANVVAGAEVPAKAVRYLDAGQTVTVVTPGGGGWGEADAGDRGDP
jgi:N-methylhydantoinase B